MLSLPGVRRVTPTRGTRARGKRRRALLSVSRGASFLDMVVAKPSRERATPATGPPSRRFEVEHAWSRITRGERRDELRPRSLVAPSRLPRVDANRILLLLTLLGCALLFVRQVRVRSG